MIEKGKSLSELLALDLPVRRFLISGPLTEILQVYIALWQEEPIGYASLGPLMASEGSRFKSALSLSIYLRPEFTRRRVGNALWKSATVRYLCASLSYRLVRYSNIQL